MVYFMEHTMEMDENWGLPYCREASVCTLWMVTRSCTTTVDGIAIIKGCSAPHRTPEIIHSKSATHIVAVRALKEALATPTSPPPKSWFRYTETACQ